MPITSLVPVDSRNTLAIQSPNTVAIPPRFPVANIDNSPHQISSRFKTQERQETFSTSNDNSNTSTLKSSAFTTAVSGTFNPGRALAPLPPSIAKNVVLLSQRWSDVEAMITKSEYQPQAKNYPLIVARINVVRQSLQNQDGVEQALATINKTASSRLQNITSLENKLPKAEISLLQSVLENGFIPTLMRVRNDNGWQELAKDTALNTLHSLCTSEERLSVILPLSELAGLERTLDAAEQLNHLDSISKMSGEIRKKTNGNEGAIKLPETMRTFGMKVDTLAAGHEATVETEFRTIRNTLKPIAGFFDRIINTKENESSEFPENIQAPHFKGTRNFAALLQLSHQENQAQLRSRMKELKARSQELCCMDYTRAVKAEIRRTESQLNEITQKLDRIAPNPLRELSLAPSGKFEEIFRETINSNINRMQETLEACGFFSALDRSTTKISDADLLKFLHQDGNALHAEMQTFQAKQKRVAEADNCGVRHLNAIEHSLAEYKENSAKEDELKVMRHQPSQGELDWLHRQEIHYFARDSILRDMIAQDERDNLPIYIICEDSHTQKVRTIGQQLDGNGEHVTNDVTELRTQRFAVKVTLKEYANLKTQEQQRQFVGSLVGFEPASDAVFRTVWLGDKDKPQVSDGIMTRKIYAEATEFNREIEFKAQTNTNLPFQIEGINLEKAVSDALNNSQPLTSTWHHSDAEPLPLTDYSWPSSSSPEKQNPNNSSVASEDNIFTLTEGNSSIIPIQTVIVEAQSLSVSRPLRSADFQTPEPERPEAFRQQKAKYDNNNSTRILPKTDQIGQIPDVLETKRSYSVIDIHKMNIDDDTAISSASFDPAEGKIPEIAHFIWEGKNMSEDNLSNILNFKRLNPEFEVKIWTTRPGSINHTIEKMLNGDDAKYRYLAFNFSDKSGESRYLKTDDPRSLFSDLPAGVHAGWAREHQGSFANHAAASDIIRLAALYQFGGTYFDADISMTGKFKSPIYDAENISSSGMLTYGSAVITAVKHSPYLKTSLDRIDANYKTSPRKADDSFYTNNDMFENNKKKYQKEDLWDVKRSTFSGRVHGTVAMTGLDIIEGGWWPEASQTGYGNLVFGHNSRENSQPTKKQIIDQHEKLTIDFQGRGVKAKNDQDKYLLNSSDWRNDENDCFVDSDDDASREEILQSFNDPLTRDWKMNADSAADTYKEISRSKSRRSSI